MLWRKENMKKKNPTTTVLIFGFINIHEIFHCNNNKYNNKIHIHVQWNHEKYS